MTQPSPKKNSRREWLAMVWLGGVGMVTVVFGQIFTRFLFPLRAGNTIGGVFDLGTLDELPGPGDPPLNVPEGRFFLVNTGQGYKALHKVCTHLDCLLSWASQEKKFVCPCHGSQFELDGICLQGPASRSMDQFVVQLVDSKGQTVAETNLATGAALPLPLVMGNQSEPQVKPDEESTEEEEEPEQDPTNGWTVKVDTGRLIKSGQNGSGG